MLFSKVRDGERRGGEERSWGRVLGEKLRIKGKLNGNKSPMIFGAGQNYVCQVICLFDTAGIS